MPPLLPRGLIRTGLIISIHPTATTAGAGEAVCIHRLDGEATTAGADITIRGTLVTTAGADFMIRGIPAIMAGAIRIMAAGEVTTVVGDFLTTVVTLAAAGMILPIRQAEEITPVEDLYLIPVLHPEEIL